MTLKVGISGIRGTVDGSEEQLDATTAVAWTQAFAGHLKVGLGAGAKPPRLAVGHDGRPSSPALAGLVTSVLLLRGCDVVSLGLAVTPGVQKAVESDPDLDGAVMVTASHNSIPWNGLKLLDGHGLFLDQSDWDGVRAHLRDVDQVDLTAVGRLTDGAEAARAAHRDAALAVADVAALREFEASVVLDACNSGALLWVPALEEAGCKVTVLHADLYRGFARGPEPLAVNLDALCAAVLEKGAILGLAADPDGDRLTLVDGEGKPVHEELTVVLAARAIVKPGDVVVTNIVTTHLLEDAFPYNRIVRTAVGEMNVVAGIVASEAVIGGEGSGGVIYPAANLARDGLVASLLILTLLAKSGWSLAEHVRALATRRSSKASARVDEALTVTLAELQSDAPGVIVSASASSTSPLVIQGKSSELVFVTEGDGVTLTCRSRTAGAASVRFEAPGLIDILQRLSAEPQCVSVNTIDGLKLLHPDAWLAIRGSNTEPILRLSGEVAL